MASITIHVLEGLERGRVYEGLPSPISIGREEENTIRLNDERISRFHAKMQEDAGRIILTDLDSTNGTRVNGRPVQMRVLRPGDQVSIGRCLLLFGSEEEIVHRAERSRLAVQPRSTGSAVDDEPEDEQGGETDSSFVLAGDRDPLPDPPYDLPPVERAQVSDVLDHVHDEIRRVLLAAEEVPNPGQGLSDMRVPGQTWQLLLRLEMELAVVLRKIADPEPDD